MRSIGHALAIHVVKPNPSCMVRCVELELEVIVGSKFYAKKYKNQTLYVYSFFKLNIIYNLNINCEETFISRSVTGPS